MLDISQVTSLLQSLGVGSTLANKAVAQTTQKVGADAQSFFKELQQSLKELSDTTKPEATTSVTQAPSNPSNNRTEVKAPFDNFTEFKEWEKNLGDTFAKDYETPDYLRMISLSLMGGDSDAFKRFVYFKNNPQYAVDYESIRSGNLSKFPTDGSTLVKTDLSTLDPEIASYYKKNPSELLAAEGFNFDPTLLKKRIDGNTEGISDPDWLTKNRWTASGTVKNDNRLQYAQANYIGLDGKGGNNYRLAKYDPATGLIVDLDGKKYDPTTGEAKTA